MIPDRFPSVSVFMKNYNHRILPTRMPLGYSTPLKDTFYYVGPGTIFIFGLSSIERTRCVPGYKTRSYLFSTPRIRRESIRREIALPPHGPLHPRRVLLRPPPLRCLWLDGSIIVPWDGHCTLKLPSSFWIHGGYRSLTR